MKFKTKWFTLNLAPWLVVAVLVAILVLLGVANLDDMTKLVELFQERK